LSAVSTAEAKYAFAGSAVPRGKGPEPSWEEGRVLVEIIALFELERL